MMKSFWCAENKRICVELECWNNEFVMRKTEDEALNVKLQIRASWLII